MHYRSSFYSEFKKVSYRLRKANSLVAIVTLDSIIGFPRIRLTKKGSKLNRFRLIGLPKYMQVGNGSIVFSPDSQDLRSRIPIPNSLSPYIITNSILQ